MDLSTMFDKVSMKAYSNIGIDLRVKFFDLSCILCMFWLGRIFRDFGVSVM